MTRLVAALLVALGLSAVPAAAGSARHSFWDPTWLPDGKSIAFVDHDGAGDIWIMRAGGTGLRKLTHGVPSADLRASQPDWSPDGRRIVFDSSARLTLMNSDGTGAEAIAAGLSTAPAWSPSGRKIAFAGGGELNGLSIYVMTPGGRPALEARASNAQISYTGPTWSPDGQFLAFSIGAAPDAGSVTTGLGIVRRPGGRVRRLLDGLYPIDPDWSPDGKSIVFSDLKNGLAIEVLTLKTLRVRSLTYGRHPRYSPDGRRIVFSRDDSRHDIWMINVDGTGLRQIEP